MSGVFQAVPTGMDAFSVANDSAGALVLAAGNADSAAMLAAAAAAVGPIGAGYLAAYGPAQANNLAATLLVGGLHTAIGRATDASKSAILAADNG